MTRSRSPSMLSSRVIGRSSQSAPLQGVVTLGTIGQMALFVSSPKCQHYYDSGHSRRPMEEDALLLGVDVGATTTAAGVVARDGEVLIEQRASTHRDGKGRVLPTIVGLIAAVRAEAEGRGRAIAAIGVGVPGAVDPVSGRVGEPVPHVPELDGRALADDIGERVGLHAFVVTEVK